MNALFRDIQYQFRKNDNAYIKLLLINVIVYVANCILYLVDYFAETGIDGWIYRQQAMPIEIMAFLYKPWTIITDFFTHSYPLPGHIFFNMLTLYWFGMIFQDLVGGKRVLSLYILGGIAGNILVLAIFNLIPHFSAQAQNAILVGASGSVIAVVVGAATLAPNYVIRLMFFGSVKIIYIAAILVFFSLIFISGRNAGGNFAHLGGAVMGYLFSFYLKRGIDLGRPVIRFMNLFSKRSPLKVSFRGNQSRKSGAEYPNQQEVDAILDKIGRTGYESLTKEEKQKLFKASQK